MSARELFEHELRDAYDAEHRNLEALGEMSSKVTNRDLSKAFDLHRDQTKRQIDRLQTAFRSIGSKPQREECEGAKGLIEEFREFVESEDPSEDVLNYFAATAAKKVEHYEIVAYESLMQLANALNFRDASTALRENLAEEIATADELQTVSEKLVADLQ